MDLNNLFQIAIDESASDLHLISGTPPTIRKDGELRSLPFPPLLQNDLESYIESILTKEQETNFNQEKELDFAFSIKGNRFRLNLHRQEGQVGISARLIPFHIPTPSEIGFDETLYKLTHLNQGLILVTGPSGSGKSTTLAVLIDIINTERRSHIITIEDPIEFLFKEKQSIIEQREIGIDSPSFGSALKHILRQDPNVIMVGEMRDLETISAVLTAAETGHLVFSTLHTSSAAETIARIVDVFESYKQRQILVQLAGSLAAVISQQLLPRRDKGLVAAREIMINTPAIASLIRQNNIAQIPSVIQTSAKEGMIPMASAIKKLLKDNIISEVIAKNRIGDLETRAVYY